MKALSVQQPWADLIMRGKDVENRSWSTNHRGPLLIHAGAKLRHGPWLRRAYGPDHEWALGGIVGMVDLVDCVQGYASPWAGDGPGAEWHWVLANPRRVPFVPMKGTLGLFEVAWPPDPGAIGKEHHRDEREFGDVENLWKRTPPMEEIARVLPAATLREVTARLGEPALPDAEGDARDAFAERFKSRLNTILRQLDTSAIHLLLAAAGLGPRQTINAWGDALGGIDDDALADDEDAEGGGLDANAATEEVDYDSDTVDGATVELVKELGVQREEGWGYWVEDGHVVRERLDDDGELDPETREVVRATGVQQEDGFRYFLDREGNLRRGRERPTPAVFEVLEWVANDCGRDALARLCDAREVPRRRSIDDLVNELADAYDGDFHLLVNDLRREDLLALLGSENGICVAKRWVRLEGASRLDAESLRKLAIAAFVDADTSAFVAAIDPTDDSDDADADSGADVNNDGGDDPSNDGKPDEAGGDPVATLRDRLSQYSGKRPIEIRSLLRKADLGEFERLRTDRFQELRGLIDEAGYVLCDEEGQPFDDTSTSPGIDARVRLRPKASPAAQAPSTSVPEPPVTAAMQASPAPVRMVTAPVSAAPAPEQPAVSDYEVAVARLRVLTCAPWTGRRSSAFWPGEFVQLACEVPLADAQLRLVRLLAEKLVDGGHDFEAQLTLLRGALDRGRLAALVDGFELLNDGAPELAQVTGRIRNGLGIG